MTRENYDVAVIGPGAMGILYAALLAFAGAKVLAVARTPEHARLIAEKGLTLHWPSKGRLIRARMDAVEAQLAVGLGARIVLVAVKSYQTGSVAPIAADLARDNGLIVTIQNGLGNDAILESRAPGRVLQAVTTWGSHRIGLLEARVGGEGETILPRATGWRARVIEWFHDLLERAGLNPRLVDDIEPWRWRKLAVNAGINPVTALAGVPNRAVAENPMLREVAMMAAREVAMVAITLGIDPGTPEEVAEYTVRVAEATGGNKSSMLQDLEACRPTEIDAINGAVVRIAEEHGIQAPTNKILYLLVKGAEEARGCRSRGSRRS